MTTLIDPSQLTYCPCGKPKPEEYVTCTRCFESSPAYWRILTSRKGATELQKARARNQILLHAMKRGLAKEQTKSV